MALAVCAGVLVAAWLLEPSPEGHGTHEQWLVVPCAFRWLTGLPCPMCGLTTAFALMARCEVPAALSAHVLGPPLYAATWVLGMASAVALVRGTRPAPRCLTGAKSARVMLLVVCAGWIVNVVIHLLRG